MGDQNSAEGFMTKCDCLCYRRLQDHNDTFYETPVCTCERAEADRQSEYEASLEWVTYTEHVDMRIFDEAARNAEADVAQRQEEAARVMVAEAQQLYGSSAETGPSAPVLDEDASEVEEETPEPQSPEEQSPEPQSLEEESPEPLSIEEESPEEESPEEESPEEESSEENNTEGAQALVIPTDYFVDEIIDEWATHQAGQRADMAKQVAKSAQEAAEEAQRDALAAREANLPNASLLEELADSSTKFAIDATKYAKRAAAAAKEVAEAHNALQKELNEAAALAEAEMAMSKLTIESTCEISAYLKIWNKCGPTKDSHPGHVKQEILK